MVLNLIYKVVYHARQLFAPQVLSSGSNNLNPTLLSIGQAGHYLQSRYFSIPDRYGFFTAGPPRLQVYQGFLVVAICSMVIISSFLLGFLGLVIAQEPQSEKRIFRVVWDLVLIQAALIGSVVALVWVFECTDRKRTADYVWKDWKSRIERGYVPCGHLPQGSIGCEESVIYLTNLQSSDGS
ncbi:hypothetical protein VTL71DRAFT_4476 [Oculimacula yallundae]|uniref:Uncharacterized protein n=1 Tax=Oculimacula yallundae TaxID=86028 RepID=A0ABR4C254_9HELO